MIQALYAHMNNKKKRMATAKLPAVYHANLRPTEGGKLKLSVFSFFPLTDSSLL
jgi:hypothetical protein